MSVNWYLVNDEAKQKLSFAQGAGMHIWTDEKYIEAIHKFLWESFETGAPIRVVNEHADSRNETDIKIWDYETVDA